MRTFSCTSWRKPSLGFRQIRLTGAMESLHGLYLWTKLTSSSVQNNFGFVFSIASANVNHLTKSLEVSKPFLRDTRNRYPNRFSVRRPVHIEIREESIPDSAKILEHDTVPSVWRNFKRVRFICLSSLWKLPPVSSGLLPFDTFSSSYNSIHRSSWNIAFLGDFACR